MEESGENVDSGAPFETHLAKGAESWIAGLDDLLEETRHLFTLISVFGAISIYLREADLPTTDPNTVPYANIVSFYGFGVVLLLLLLILIKLISRMMPSNSGETLLSSKNMPYIVFLLLLAPIILVLVQYLSTFQAAAGLFWVSLSYVLALLTYLGAHDHFIKEVEIHGMIADKHGRSRITVLSLISIGVAITALIVFTVGDIYYGPIPSVSAATDPRATQPSIVYFALFTAIWFWLAVLSSIITAGRVIVGTVRSQVVG